MPTSSAPFLFRVCFSDTDAAGFVHHARYLEMFERSRAEWLNQMDCSPAKLVGEFGIALSIRELTMNFHKPSRLNDLLSIDQSIEQRGRSQVSIKQTAKRVNSDALNGEMELIASLSLHIVCVDIATVKSKELPDWLLPVSTEEM